MADSTYKYRIAQLVEHAALDGEVEGSSPSPVAKARKNQSKIWKNSNEEFVSIWGRCSSLTEVLHHFGLENKGGNHRTVHRRAQQLGLTSDKFASNQWIGMVSANKRMAKQLHEWLRDGTKPSSAIRRRALMATGRPYVCSKCGQNDKWQNERLVLQINHIDGISTHNRPENLEFLCPNCHSQTANFAGRKNRLPILPLEILLRVGNESIKEMAQRLGVSLRRLQNSLRHHRIKFSKISRK